MRLISYIISLLIGTHLFSQMLLAQGYPASEAPGRMKVAEGFEVQLVASEPLVRQPVAMEFDDRGRLWVIQYLQYPNPAGLKRVQVDRYSRTKYDRNPEPPPKGPKGADRISILTDTNGDGIMDSSKDFITGLNLASGMAFGHGGVFVLNVPYLLFYPDKNRDDVPDSDPEVLLTGFGMEDAHSVANSLTWGPDGWLYGCQGSTVTSNIRGIEFQQGVWRYHPISKKFELFCEGGGNSWGLDFDATGRLLYSTNYGGHVLLHGVQGAYYTKSFGKHGALHNPRAYGYFPHAPHKNFRGGHVTVGGIVYQGDSFPEKFQGKYIAGDLLGHGVYWHEIHPNGSTVQTSHGGELLLANDTWFGTTDVTLGPEGAVYVADWHDARKAHPDPDATWDRSNGRIYRIIAKGTKPAPIIDFQKQSNTELLKLHEHKSQWYVRHARQELTRRYHEEKASNSALESINKLKTYLKENALNKPDQKVGLESLWTLACLDGFDESLADKLLNSPNPAIRTWTVRLVGDTGNPSKEMAHRLDKFAEKEPALEVRQQLACTAARFPPAQAMPIINANINRNIDSMDPFIPMLWWWAVEKHSIAGREEVMKRFVRPSLLKSKVATETLLTRLIRTYASEATPQGYESVFQLLKAHGGAEVRAMLWPQIIAGIQEQSLPNRSAAPKELSALILLEWQKQPSNLSITHLGLLFGMAEMEKFAAKEAFDSGSDANRRSTLLGMLAQSPRQELIPPALKLVQSDEKESLKISALLLLGRYESPEITSALLQLHQTNESSMLQARVRQILLSRKSSARIWLQEVDRGNIKPTVATLDEVRNIALLEDPALDALVAKHWGKLDKGSREEKLAEVRRLNNDLNAGTGNEVIGKAVFSKHCANCHQLFGQGNKVGPDLTTANRQDRSFMLQSLVDPNSTIRREYVSVIIQTRDGRVITGLPIAKTDREITLVNAKNERTMVPLGNIEDIMDSQISLMPEDLYRQLSPAELRDLFAYLQSKKEGQP